MHFRDTTVPATMEKFNIAMEEGCPPYDPPELPDCTVKEPKTQKTYAEGIHPIREECGWTLWRENSTGPFHSRKVGLKLES